MHSSSKKVFLIYVTLNGKYSIPGVKGLSSEQKTCIEFTSMGREPESQINN